jgi:hypothetical protein
MVTSNKKVAALAIVAAGMLTATIVAYSYKPAPASTFEKNMELVRGLELPQVFGIKVRAEGKETDLRRTDDGFVVAQRDGYPAANKEINDLLMKVVGIRCVEKVADSSTSHAQLGVADDAKGSCVELTGKDGKKMLTLLVGQNARGGGNYVRLAPAGAVYASDKPLWLSGDPVSYVQTQLTDIPREKIVSVSVSTKAGKYTIGLDKDKKPQLEGLPAGKKPKATDVEAVFNALTMMTFEDVSKLTKEIEKSVQWEGTFTCKLENLEYQVQFGKRDGKSVARLDAVGPSQDLLEASSRIAKAESKERLAKKDAIFQADEAAKRFNAQHAGWLYQVSDWKGKDLCRPVTELVEDESAEPKEIAASHVLIAYKGANRAGAGVTRTKEQAAALAQEVLTKAQAPGADFVALAKQYSDCPSKDKGGDLGTFAKGAMDKNFEQAAWKLKVGQTSGIVETPFGFHVIKRTK